MFRVVISRRRLLENWPYRERPRLPWMGIFSRGVSPFGATMGMRDRGRILAPGRRVARTLARLPREKSLVRASPNVAIFAAAFFTIYCLKAWYR